MIRQRLVSLGRLIGRVAGKSSRDEVGLRASAIAFSTLISAVPLLAVVSIFVARTLREDDGRILDLIAELLPYREEAVLSALRSFLDQAESVSGIAVLGFVVTSVITFFGVQESLFQIYRIERVPSFARRLVTFSLLFFWGPLLVGVTQAGLLFLRNWSPEVERLLSESLTLRLLPVAITFLGLTMLYWRAAFRTVSLRDAATGAAVATVLLLGLKQLFGFYAHSFTMIQRAVYGTFAIALFFVISLQLAWYILLLGAELSAVLALDRSRVEEEAAPPIEPDPWVGVGALEMLAAPGLPRLAVAELGERLTLDDRAVARHLAPLVEAGLLESDGGYRLALPPARLRIATALAAYRRLAESRRAGPLPARTALLRLRLRQELEHDVGDETLADLTGEAALPAPPGPDAGADSGPDSTGPEPPASLAGDPPDR